MLGKHHTSISLLSVAPMILLFYLIPSDQLPFTFDTSLLVVFLGGVFIGSLLPDADSPKATIYYKFPSLDKLMKLFMKPLVWMFNLLKQHKKIELEHEVKEEHRGILHSPIGVMLSSGLIGIILLVLVLASGGGLALPFTFFVGILVGQFLHLLEDSCTVSGINWKFPFGTKIVNGKIYTFQKFEGKTDIRPDLFVVFLSIPSISLLFKGRELVMTYGFLVVLGGALLAVVFIWMVILFVSKSGWSGWYQDKVLVKNIKRAIKGHRNSRKPYSLTEGISTYTEFSVSNSYHSIFHSYKKRKSKKSRKFDRKKR